MWIKLVKGARLAVGEKVVRITTDIRKFNTRNNQTFILDTKIKYMKSLIQFFKAASEYNKQIYISLL